jgi:hypothetical protein
MNGIPGIVDYGAAFNQAFGLPSAAGNNVFSQNARMDPGIGP